MMRHLSLIVVSLMPIAAYAAGTAPSTPPETASASRAADSDPCKIAPKIAASVEALLGLGYNSSGGVPVNQVVSVSDQASQAAAALQACAAKAQPPSK